MPDHLSLFSRQAIIMQLKAHLTGERARARPCRLPIHLFLLTSSINHRHCLHTHTPFPRYQRLVCGGMYAFPVILTLICSHL